MRLKYPFPGRRAAARREWVRWMPHTTKISSVELNASPILLAIAGIALLSAMDALIKHLAETHNVLLVTFARYAIGACFAALIWARAGAPTITRDMWRAHGARGLVIALSATSFFWSLSVLPLVEALTLSFIAPLLVPFVARVLLGERVRVISLIAGALGFVGVLIALQGAPEAAAGSRRFLGVCAVLFAAVTYALSITLMRMRARLDGAPIVNLLASFIPCLIVAAPAIVFSAPPHVEAAPLFLILGLLGATGVYLMARAYAGAEAQTLAPIEYTALIWASLLGYLVFGETPRPPVLVGAAVIIAACLIVAWDERRLSPKLESP